MAKSFRQKINKEIAKLNRPLDHPTTAKHVLLKGT